MNWYKTAKQWNHEIMNHKDFIGFHCQQKPRSDYDDIISNNNNYAESHFLYILDALPFEIRNKAVALNLMDKPDDYSDEFDIWAENVHEFLLGHNIRWIFVSMNKPLEEHYGEYRYCVSIPESEVLHIFDDPNVNDVAYAYLYDANKVRPTCILIPEEEDGYNNELV